MGAVLLVLLFYPSTQFSEGVTSSKYPEYASYVAVTPKFIPRLFTAQPSPNFKGDRTRTSQTPKEAPGSSSKRKSAARGRSPRR